MTSKKDTYRIYLVEDDPSMLDRMKKEFTLEGFTVDVFHDGPPMLRHVGDHGLPHLAVIDLNLPNMHGFDVSEKLRAMGDVPIIFVSSENAIETKIEGISKYADDYVVKPFEMPELVARIRRVLSRITDFSYAQGPVVRIDARLAIDFGNSRLLIEERTVPLTPTETTLLHVLLRNRGNVVSSESLITRVWPRETVYEETLRVHMHRLRGKLEPDPRTPYYIHTERGVGYRFVE